MYEEEEQHFFKSVAAGIRDLLITLTVVFLMVTYVAQLTNVSGQSMYPTLNDHDWLVIEKVSMRITPLERFDVVVFPYANNAKVHYIKRIIGLPGETVDIRDGKIYVDGQELQDPFAYEPIYGEDSFTTSFPVTVGEGEYFVMGDNRNNSSDSRYADVGLISRQKIIGKALIRVFPLTHIELIDHS
ncbi:signal peptidase I [Anaerotalea alkaliphila]|uniref:Signal peptidase I n=1 Tax=Anaerotalea alkaliphila TaxID=2662126 RepID=A0A7X5HX10_9FIRM|nr:signal peptidase I [Anaerotalea alkaliphila]NDL68175.1 signal peptidase I [Anaerotalea alkaliphila]